ncbi:MAG: T9SS type A sorting domain-containing protein [Chitinophagales bacterium]
MKKATLLLNLIICFHFIYGQSPDIEWQNTIGSYSPDWVTTSILTDDGGYLVCGYTTGPPSGDKTAPLYGVHDFWVVKLDNTGALEWQKSLGGNKNETLYTAIQLNDGSYLLGGSSLSNISGVKTQNCNGGTTHGDGWLVKLSPTGTILWDKVFGGPGEDYIRNITQSADGNCVLICYATIGAHAQKAEIGNGSYDCWIIKINTDGDIIWENTIGGAGSDFPMDIQSLNDGSLIVAAQSDSNISGDKTQNNKGGLDYWIFKLSSAGDILWQQTIGGDNYDYVVDVRSVGDYFYIGGYSISGMSGDKTEALTNNNRDFWIIKIDSVGNIIWDQAIGSLNIDYYTDINSTVDGGLIVCGYNNAGIGGDKTEGNMGGNDFWIMKLNHNGEIVWDEVIGGSDNDFAYGIIQTPDNGYLISGSSKSDISGDKTEDSEMFLVGPFEDYWIVKLAADCIAVPELCNSLDDNCNGLIDDGITETISISAGGPISFCQGGSVLLTATYSGASLQWKKNGTNIPGATGATYNVTTKGNYTCVTTSACGTVESTPIFVNVIKNPNASISAGGPTTFCAGGSVVLTEVAVAGCTYQWYKGASPIAGATSLTYTATASGNYKCRVTKAATGCYKNSNAIAVSVPCREENNIIENTFSLYPNPANNFITIETDFSTEKTIYITDALGQIVKTITTSENNITIDLNGIASGVYFIKMEDGINSVTKKFIKQ